MTPRFYTPIFSPLTLFRTMEQGGLRGTISVFFAEEFLPGLIVSLILPVIVSEEVGSPFLFPLSRFRVVERSSSLGQLADACPS